MWDSVRDACHRRDLLVPYPGLRPFRREEAELFFGREEQVDELGRKLGAQHFVAVVGPSGCGKSSLIYAGLLPELESGLLLDVQGDWRFATIRPGDQPITRLAEALVGAMGNEKTTTNKPDYVSEVGFLCATLFRGPLGLLEAIGETNLLEGGSLLLLVDQFEELFRFRREEGIQEADAFVAMLLETARQAYADPQRFPIYIAITMRSDFLGHCDRFNGLPEAINKSQYLTPRMNRRQRRAAIIGPAAMFGADVDEALVNQLLNDMGDDPDQLPIMQHALMRMWERAKEIDGYESTHDPGLQGGGRVEDDAVQSRGRGLPRPR
jgi:energy-coupling factor transporter ATP-binding protein EcfA2